MQGDSKIRDIGNLFGVTSEFTDDQLVLSNSSSHSSEIYYDFINQPDLAQTVAVMCAGKGVKSLFTGLKTLRIKETDRIAALQKELGKIGSDMPLSHVENNQEYYAVEEQCVFQNIPRFETYKDHRMAMAFAPLALLHPIEIHKPHVVSKSYPGFWSDLQSLGFEIEEV